MLMAMRGRRVLLVYAVVATAVACGPAGECPNDVPATCPSPAPSFSGEVQGIIQSRCVSCHAPGGQEQSRPLQTYQQIYSQRIGVLSQVASCRMPLAGAAPLTPEERQALLGWLVCSAPNN
jgi:uncharacterized membrane protein